MTVHIITPYGALCGTHVNAESQVIPFEVATQISLSDCATCKQKAEHLATCPNCKRSHTDRTRSAFSRRTAMARWYMVASLLYSNRISKVETLMKGTSLDRVIEDAMVKQSKQQSKEPLQSGGDDVPPIAEEQDVNLPKEEEETEMSSTAKNINPADIEVQRTGQVLIVPEGLDYNQAIKALQRRAEEEVTEISVNHNFTMTPPEGAIAMMRTLQELYGFVSPTSTPGFFGPTPPAFIGVDVAPGKTEQVPWGRLVLPGIKGFLQPGIEWKLGIPYFQLGGRVLGKHKAEVQKIADHIRARVDSLYRGHAIRISFPKQDEASSLEDFLPRFMDMPEEVNEASLIFPQETEDLVQTTLFTPIEYSKECRENGVPLKRGILLEGPYGVGKTLTATLTAKKCVANGWTFLYLDNVENLPKALSFARQYQPCVIFAEDIDQVLKDSAKRDEQVNSILNSSDGIESKGVEIITVLTTNNVDKITKAMLRPGRLDTVIAVRPPDAEAARRLVQLYAKDQLAEGQDLTVVGERLANRIPAVIREVVERSKLGAIRRAAKLGKAALIHAEDVLVATISMEQHLKLLEVPVADTRPDIVKAAATLGELLRPVPVASKSSNGKATTDSVATAAE